MEVRQDGYVWDAPHILHCRCGASNYFEIQFRKSESIQMYEEMGGTGHKPDTMVVVCSRCGTEVTITETEAKMPPPRPPSFNPMAEQARRTAQTFQEYVEAQTRMPHQKPDWEDLDSIREDLYGFKAARERRARPVARPVVRNGQIYIEYEEE